eukprot:3643818-Amphidinium_carterae.1
MKSNPLHGKKYLLFVTVAAMIITAMLSTKHRHNYRHRCPETSIIAVAVFDLKSIGTIANIDFAGMIYATIAQTATNTWQGKCDDFCHRSLLYSCAVACILVQRR